MPTDQNEQQQETKSAHSDIKLMRSQLDRLTSVVGEQSLDIKVLIDALQGNKFGNEGLVGRVIQNEKELEKMNAKIDELTLATKKKEMYLYATISLIGFIGGSLITIIVKYFMSK